MERAVSVVGSATAFERFMAPAHKRVLEFAYQARFANPGIANDPDHPQPTRLRCDPMLFEGVQFATASDERCYSWQSNAGARVVRTVSLCQTENPEKRPGLIESLQKRYVLEGLETEALLDDPTRGFADDQRSRHRD